MAQLIIEPKKAKRRADRIYGKLPW